MSKENQTPRSILQILFDHAIEEKQVHYRKEWEKFTGKHRTVFYDRLKRPHLIDLALWQAACDELVYSDRAMGIIENEHPKLKDVKVFRLSEKYLNEINKNTTSGHLGQIFNRKQPI